MDIPELKIEEAYDAKPAPFPSRTIGASGVGQPCDALMQLSLRRFPDKKTPAHLQRIFATGHRMEDEIVADLLMAGYSVIAKDPLTGKQHTFTDYGGHVKCKLDGLILRGSEWHILEIKSMNNDNWTKFKDKGVRVSHPKYYAQMQMMMGMSGHSKATFFARNKDNSKDHSEVVEFDPFFYSALMVRVDRAINGEATRVATDETDWRCRGCFKSDACWGKQAPEKHCYSCAHSEPVKSGLWFCGKHGVDAPGEACGEYEVFVPKPRIK